MVYSRGAPFCRAMYTACVMQCTVWATPPLLLYTQRGTSGGHMIYFSINNAPLIIVLLFKGEWQSSLSSRGGGGPVCLCEGLLYIFGKCTFVSRGSSPVRFHSIPSLNFLCCGGLASLLHTGCIMAPFLFFCVLMKTRRLNP